MFFAGFALFLNGVSYFVPFNRKTLGIVNLLCAGLMIANTAGGALLNVPVGELPTDFYANAAGGCAFALNFLILGIHHLKELEDFALFGWFSLLMCVVSATFLTQACILSFPWIFIYLWAMWAVLWGQAFIASGLKIKAVDKLSPYFVLGNAVFSLIVPGILLLLNILP